MRWVMPHPAGRVVERGAAAAEDWGDDGAAADPRAVRKWFVADDDVLPRARARRDVSRPTRNAARGPRRTRCAAAPGMKGHWGWLGEQGCGGSDDCAMAFPWMNAAAVSAAARGFRRAPR